MPLRETYFRHAFQISVILKGLHALIEIAGGALFYLARTETVLHWVNVLTREELLEDPRDFVATHLLAAAQGMTGATQSFYAFYLMSHGVIKVVLVAGLLRRKPVAYPLSLIVMTLFILYQLYRYSYTHSAGLLFLTGFDLVVMWLVWHEWRVMRGKVRA
ncbi:hypothetical protein CEW89_19610 [Celeribacter ethanolicus]|uniref:DUF2127 domain-containing protein n=1 Tax=Celeribacter ethanolicus TaxID=1758178 RepID=A0A291GHR6_9RHOB|nr:DUF2127 domain-containing protein [Celeribacter ethanolicus]ATG49582.1 hypothetical protein CEW89_19610 [Celeribacter ethanolicus]